MPLDPKFQLEILEIFQVELKEQYGVLVDHLIKLESVKDPVQLESLIQTLFRASHNIKGAAKSVGIDTVANIAHRLEDVFSEWKETKTVPVSDDVTACLHVADNLIKALEDYLLDPLKISTEDYLQPFKRHVSEIYPARDVDKVSDINEGILRVPLKKIEHANTNADELLFYQLKMANVIQYLATPAELSEQLTNLSKVIEAKCQNHGLLVKEELDVMFSAFYHQVKLINQSFVSLKKDLTALHSEFSMVLHALQNDLRGMRLIPIAKILEPLKRSVRDLAASLQKKVDLVIEGDDIELDKSILDLIKDPLHHLIRNAIDHGIELPEVRKNTGKNVIGLITIRVSQIAGKIHIQFSDDGRGIDREMLCQVALHKNLIEASLMKQLDDQQLLELIFLPGFSTQVRVTEISGRGVGLDVVRANVELAKGKISIDSTLNKGTQFTLMLPLTLVTTRALYVRCKDQQFALPSNALSNICEIKLTDIKSVERDQVYIVNDAPIPVRKLADLLGLMDENAKAVSSYFGVLLKRHGRKVYVLVDEIISEYECVIKPLPELFTSIKNVSGATLTAKGELVLVLNPVDLMNAAFMPLAMHIPQMKTVVKASVKPAVLVVDDSITTRNLEVNALTAAGYLVSGAASGIDALEKLKAAYFDVVITDIEMPLMDGYELTRAIKGNAQYQHIPVVIVSSHESDADKQRAIAAGAVTFLVKSQFNTNALVELVASLVV